MSEWARQWVGGDHSLDSHHTIHPNPTQIHHQQSTESITIIHDGWMDGWMDDDDDDDHAWLA